MNGGDLKKPNAKKPKIKKMDIAVFAVLSQVFLYTWVHLILSTVVGVEIAPTATVAFYGFCGAEAGLLALIKKSKIKQNREDENYETDNFAETDEP